MIDELRRPLIASERSIRQTMTRRDGLSGRWPQFSMRTIAPFGERLNRT